MSTDSKKEVMDVDESEANTQSSDDNNSEDESNNNSREATIENSVRENIKERYKSRHGKQLYIRFPAKLPEDESEFQNKARALSPLIVEAHKPRQKHARFCLVQFNSKEDRDQALKSIRESIKTDDSFKGIVALIPRTESEEFVDELVKKKVQSLEAKRTKARLKRLAARDKKNKNFTSMIVVRNMPANVSMVELRRLFPSAVDIQLKSQDRKKGTVTIVTVTMQSSFEARQIVKSNLSINGTPLNMRFGRAVKNKNKSDEMPNSKE